ncbi:MAG: hypothetical protein R3B82_16845 [Sandaracinaceae bacterium]
MPRQAPPAGDQERGAALGLEHLGGLAPHGSARVATEALLLEVRVAEDHVPHEVQRDQHHRRPDRELERLGEQVLLLQGEVERHPHEERVGQHEPVVLVDDVEHREQVRLEDEEVDDVEELADAHDAHRERDAPGLLELGRGQEDGERAPDAHPDVRLEEELLRSNLPNRGFRTVPMKKS